MRLARVVATNEVDSSGAPRATAVHRTSRPVLNEDRASGSRRAGEFLEVRP